MATIGIARETNDNPLDVVEHLAAGNSWPFERAGEDEISIVVTGRWTNYQISFTWMSDIEALHLACAFDMRVPELRLTEVRQLVALINEQLWIGHFDIWQHNGVVMFRHALVLAGAHRLGPAMRSGAGQRARFLRAVFPGVSIRGLGRQIRPRIHGRHPVRDRRRGLSRPSFRAAGGRPGIHSHRSPVLTR